MTKGPRQPRPCDICGAPNAPFGYARKGGRAAQKPGQRPLWACAAPACRDQAEARKARADAPLGTAGAPRPAQSSLFD